MFDVIPCNLPQSLLINLITFSIFHFCRCGHKSNLKASVILLENGQEEDGHKNVDERIVFVCFFFLHFYSRLNLLCDLLRFIALCRTIFRTKGSVVRKPLLNKG